MARLAGVVVALVVLLALAGCREGDAADYDEAYRTDFLSHCTDAYDGQGGPQVCGCWYDALVREVDFGDLPTLDDLVADDFDIAPTRLPGGELEVPLQLLAGCVRTLGAGTTLGDPVPPPTIPRPPTTPPTTTTTQ